MKIIFAGRDEDETVAVFSALCHAKNAEWDQSSFIYTDLDRDLQVDLMDNEDNTRRQVEITIEQKDG